MKNPYIGSPVESLFEELGTLGAVRAAATKKILAEKLRRLMAEKNLTKQSLAAKMATSRPALDRLLDPDTTGVSLATLAKAAVALDVDLTVDFVPRAPAATKVRGSREVSRTRGHARSTRASATTTQSAPKGGRKTAAVRA